MAGLAAARARGRAGGAASNIEFLRFLRRIDREVPKGLQVHLILDNYATHKHPNVIAWLEKHTPLPSPLHAHVELVAEPRRTMVPRPHRQGDPPRSVQVRARSHHSDRGLPAGQQHRSQAVRVDGERGSALGEGSPRPGAAQQTSKLIQIHYNCHGPELPAVTHFAAGMGVATRVIFIGHRAGSRCPCCCAPPTCWSMSRPGRMAPLR